ncbi:MAG: hypothetical protein ACLGI2_17630 [Acidimicrobiia bacterium]
MLREAFLAGWVPPTSGRYFNGIELLAEADRGAPVELAKQIGGERERVVRQREAGLAGLDRADEMQRALGLEPLPRPATAEEFGAWAEAVFSAVTDHVATTSGPGSPCAVVHLAGYVLGEALATLDAVAILCRLRELAPEHLWMRVQADSLEGERQAAERRLARLASHELLSEPVRTAIALAAHAVAEAAPTGSYEGQAARARAAVEALAEQAAAIERAL